VTPRRSTSSPGLLPPHVEYHDDWWPTFDWLGMDDRSESTAGAPPGGFNVLDRQRVGPFDVTRLEAGDPAASAKWLSDNGFPNPAGLEQNLAQYVADNWQLVAVKLVPADADGELVGQLQPLTLSLHSTRVVYPMRLSRSAKLPQRLDLYVLADHRMDPSALPVADAKPAVEFAGPQGIRRGACASVLYGEGHLPDALVQRHRGTLAHRR
jgi:hypothetical protein